VKLFSKVDWLKNSSFQLSHLILDKQSEICAEGQDVLVVYDHFKKEKENISIALRKKIEHFEGKIF
jgi:acyl-CoA thioester hydrolase